MVGALLELHHDIKEGHLGPTLSVQGVKVPGKNILVHLLLSRGQIGPHNKLGLGRHVLEHVGLHTPQHVGTQELVQHAHLFLLGNVLEGALELGQIVELAGREEVEEVEQLLQIVLQRGTSQQHFVVERVGGQDLEELGLVVFQSVGLVHHEHLPLNGVEAGGIDGDDLVGGQQHVELDRAGLDPGGLIGLPDCVLLEGELVLADHGSRVPVQSQTTSEHKI